MRVQTVDEPARGRYSSRAMRERALAVLLLAALGCSKNEPATVEAPFTLIMVPDTQGMVDFTRQKATGFAIDGSELFLEEMEYIASRSVANGGNVVFVASVGDVWQHVVTDSDPEHEARGVESLGSHRMVEPEGTLEFEIPLAIAGYELISQAGVPFGIAPGNHDFDAWFIVEGEPSLRANGTVGPPPHVGGLSHFREAFGSGSDFFRGRPWYVGEFEGGGSSAQVFSAGGYDFLHLALEMQPDDDVLAWAEDVLEGHPGLPTILSTHDFLNPRGERAPSGMNLKAADPEGHNLAEDVWQELIRESDQIFLVLSGHQAGQAWRVDENDAGHEVVQLLADFQARGQAGLDAGQPRRPNGNAVPLGDGWLREMDFYLEADRPRIEVRTYSTHYDAYSSELDTYAAWYREREQPGMTDEEFLAADEFTIELTDFRARFGSPPSH